MRKSIAILISILLLIAFVLCGCVPQPYAEQVIKSNGGANDNPSDPNSSGVGETDEAGNRVLYVSGAVCTDGYVTIPQICDYKTLFDIVGVTDFTSMPQDLSKLIEDNRDSYIANYICDGVTYNSVNVNSAYVTARLSIDGVASAIVNKLADYIEAYGAITNRNQLKLALGDDYGSNYYKFYIGKLDYAQSS